MMALSGSIPRAARILEVLAEAPEGASLSDVVAASGFSKTTTFRVLSALHEVRLVEQHPLSRRYSLGRKLSDLARRAGRADLATRAVHACKRLAELSGDTVFLSAPEGVLSICVLRRTGSFPVRTLTLEPGDARPLGVGAGSLALYCAMDRRYRRAACRANRGWLAEYGVNEAMLEEDVAAFRETGYALNRGRVIEGTCAVAVPVIASCGEVVGALAIGAIDARMSEARINDLLVPALQVESRLLAARFDDCEEGEPVS